MEEKRKLVLLKDLGIRYPCDPHKEIIINQDIERTSRDLYFIRSQSRTLKDKEEIIYSYSKTDSKSLDYFLGAITEVMALYDTMDVYSDNPDRELVEKIDRFLLGRGCRKFKELLNSIDFDSIIENDFSFLSKRALKRKLFEYRAKMYLSGFAVVEDKGYDIKEVIASVSKSKIIPLKKEEREPTYDTLTSILNH